MDVGVPRETRAGERRGVFGVEIVAYHDQGIALFDTIEEMHNVYDRYKGHTVLTADPSGWQLLK